MLVPLCATSNLLRLTTSICVTGCSIALRTLALQLTYTLKKVVTSPPKNVMIHFLIDLIMLTSAQGMANQRVLYLNEDCLE